MKLNYVSAVKFLAASAVLSSSLALAADPSGVSFTIHHHYLSPRAVGMGDAFTAVANDYSALFYNPAGLARREFGEINLNLDLAVTTNLINFMQDIDKAQKTGTSDTAKQNAVLDVLTKQYGKAFGGRFGLGGIWARPGWALGIIPLDVSLEMVPHQGVGPSINTTLYGDTTVAYGYAHEQPGVLPGYFSWGVTGKFVNRLYFSKSVNFVELAADPNLVKKEDLAEGYTIDADVGGLWSPVVPNDGFFSFLQYAKPTFGATVKNLAETGFGSSLKLVNKTVSSAPEKMYRVLDLGASFELPQFWIFSGRTSFDVRDIGHPLFSVKKGLHAGIELDWTMTSWWKGAYRFGINQGYVTAGVSAMFTVLALDLVTYSEDVGTYNSPVENRIYMLRGNINL